MKEVVEKETNRLHYLEEINITVIIIASIHWGLTMHIHCPKNHRYLFLTVNILFCIEV